jgi:hypothetical protein
MEPYKYSPLRKDRSRIRLVRLLPGPVSADLEIEIFHAKTSAKYEALSYVWGPPERTDIVHVSKPARSPKPLSQLFARMRTGSRPRTTLGITHNLAVALHHLRHPEKSRVLWIDAICINQDDLVERSAEVLEMGSIYGHAKEVIVWLGPSSEDSRLAIETLSKLAEGRVFDSEKCSFYSNSDSWAAFLRDNPEALVSNALSWFAIKDLLHREWFSRLWVYQEIMLAKKATVIVGNDGIDWEPFVAAAHWIWAMLGELKRLLDDFEMEDFTQSSIAGFLTLPSESLKRHSGEELSYLLEKTARMNCFDPRDRLYAIRSLAYPKVRGLIIPDYGIGVEEAFRDFTVRLIGEYEDGGNILTRCTLRNTPSTRQMPSWVPDFSSPTDLLLINGFRPCGQSKFGGVVTNESLSLQAVKMATISTLMSPLQPDYTYTEIIKACRSWEASCESNVYAGGGSTANAFIDTILCGWREELFPHPGNMTFLTLENCRKALDGFGKDIESDDMESLATRFGQSVRSTVRRGRFFKTLEGFIGLCPDSARAGDVVVIGLGVNSPLILRPVTHEGKSCYLVVGTAYLSGAMHIEAFFGSVPVGWELTYQFFNDSYRMVFTQGDVLTQEDPRVALPPQWRYKYVPQKDEPNTPKEMLDFDFENVKTKETSWYDPRLTPEALRERGVNLQEFILV